MCCVWGAAASPCLRCGWCLHWFILVLQPLQLGDGLWDKLQHGRTTCGHGLLGCSALMNCLSRHFKSTCVFVIDKVGVVDVAGLNVLMERRKL